MTTENNNLLAEENTLVDVQPTEITSTENTSSDESGEVIEEIDYKTWDKAALIKAFGEAAKSPQPGVAIKTSVPFINAFVCAY